METDPLLFRNHQTRDDTEERTNPDVTIENVVYTTLFTSLLVDSIPGMVVSL